MPTIVHTYDRADGTNIADSKPVTGTTVGVKRYLDVINLKKDEALRIDEASSTVTYIGYAAVGSKTSDAVWKIKRITKSGTETIIEYADGNSNYDNVWDNRTSLDYS